MDMRFLSAVRHNWAVAVCGLGAALAAFAVGITWAGKAPSERAALIDEIATYHHLFSREVLHLVEIPAEQADELQAWLSERVGRDIKVPELDAVGLRFVGGRMLVIDGAPVATLMYTRAHGLPVAFTISRIAGDDAPPDINEHGSERIASWITGGYAYVVVGEIDDAMAKTLVSLVSAQLNS